jgi:hypothetical protein
VRRRRLCGDRASCAIDVKHSPTTDSRSPCGLFNFRPSVRPVPIEVHIQARAAVVMLCDRARNMRKQGYPGKHYCPRMATMNKPCYQVGEGAVVDVMTWH